MLYWYNPARLHIKRLFLYAVSSCGVFLEVILYAAKGDARHMPAQ
jgi:hypothetical protein